MDANAELATIRALCTAIESDGQDLDRYVGEYAAALVPLFRSLDERMSQGDAPRVWLPPYYPQNGESDDR